MQKSLI
jgi:hypothetical protein